MDLERLRAIVKARHGPGRAAGEATGRSDPTPASTRAPSEPYIDPAPDLPGVAHPAAVRAALGGRLLETRFGSCLVVERRYDSFRSHGRVRLGDCMVADGLPLRILAGEPAQAPPLPAAAVAVADAPARTWGASTEEPSLLFVDLETSGLNGGVGTCAFIVGCGFFDRGEFVTEQYVLTGFARERALLEAVEHRLEAATTIVTYNGKSFDLPVMDMRWLFHRTSLPVGGKRHLDLLHPARRLWRSAAASAFGGSCSLVSLERILLGFTRLDDVPGGEIPARFFGYLRSGDSRLLEPVLEHNRLDLLSLACLTARAHGLVEGGPPAAASVGECLALGQIYERAGLRERAATCYEHAARGDGWLMDDGLDDLRTRVRLTLGRATTRELLRAEALRRLARLHRREGRHAEAAGIWERILAMRRPPEPMLREANEALAIYHEHRARNLSTARRFATEVMLGERDPKRLRAARHRLARVERKLDVQQQGGRTAALPMD